MNNKSLNNKKTLLFVFIGIVVIDFAIRILVRQLISKTGPFWLIPDVIQLVLIQNKGAAFGLLSQAYTFLTFISTISLICMLFIVFFQKAIFTDIFLEITIMAGGAAGNLAERIICGSITDYIRLAFIKFPVFNFADICIVISVIKIIFGFIREDITKRI